MTSGYPKLPSHLLPLIFLNFLFPRAECCSTINLPNKNDTSTDNFIYHVTNPVRFLPDSLSTISTSSNPTRFITKKITGTTVTTRSPVRFTSHTTSAPLSTTETDCFRVDNVTHSSVAIYSKKPSTLNVDKYTDSRTSFEKSLSVGILVIHYLEACTSYRLHVDPNCSAFVNTSYRAPEPVTNIGASLSKGILNVTWRSHIWTVNCISHYEVKFMHNANRTRDSKSVTTQYFAVSVPETEKSYVSVTTIDVRGRKTTSDVFEVIIRGNLAVVTNQDTSPTRYLPKVQPVCQECVNPFKNKIVAVARNDTRAYDSCFFSSTSPEYLQIGGQSVSFRVNFSCFAYNCTVECCVLRPGFTKCAMNPLEEWSVDRTTGGFWRTVVKVTGDKLSRNEKYSCSVEVFREVPPYRYIKQASFSTTDGRPAPPGRVWAASVTSTSFLIAWDPSPPQDPVLYYILTVAPEQPNYRYDPSCRYPYTKKTFNTTTVTPQAVNGLLPYFVHQVYVDAYNSYGSTRSLTEKLCTKPSAPENCGNAEVVKPIGNTTTSVDPVHRIKWSEPCFWNAHPRDTVMRIVGKRPDNPNKTTVYEDYFHNFSNAFAFNASRDFVYSVEIIARTEKFATTRCAGPFTITVAPGLPVVSSKWLKVRPEVYTPDDGGSPVVSIPLHQNLLDDSNGTIKHVAIMVAQKGHQGSKERVFQSLPSWPDARSWYEAMSGDNVLLYQATPKLWSPPLLEDNAIHTYNLGSDNCLTNETYQTRRLTDTEMFDQSIGPTIANVTGPEANEIVYCNGPLRKNIEYVVRLRLFTSVGYSDSDDIYFRTGHTTSGWTSLYDQLWVYGVFPVFLVTVLLLTTWIRKQRYRIWTNAIASAPSSDMIESGSKRNRLPRSRRRSISPQKLPGIASRLLAQRCTLEKEFEDLNEVSAEWAAKVPCTVGLMKENRLKNRYADVVPYDYNRVKLSSESTSHTDYINASFVKGFSMDTEYIACQGPTVETSNDFWQMVFDQNVCFIVMLTSLVENGMAKCSQYFSELCENKEWMDFTVKCSSRLDLSSYTVRELQLYKKTNSEKRFIQHFQFRDWPDFGCPRDIDGILEFCDVLRGNFCLRGDSKTVVHCSAGIGRTGTLIALDILLQFVHYNRKMDIMRTVLRLREQRQWMVRTTDQYAFLYRCLKTAAERHFSPES